MYNYKSQLRTFSKQSWILLWVTSWIFLVNDFSGFEGPEGEKFLVMTRRKYCAPNFFYKRGGFFPPFLQDTIFMGNYLP